MSVSPPSTSLPRRDSDSKKVSGSTPIDAPVDRRAERRVERRNARRAENRNEILDAAEQVFGEHGPRDGSIRKIADVSGFSSAAIYLFFDNKQHLFTEVLSRRGDELLGELASAAAGDAEPIEKLHLIIVATIAFFSHRPDFRRLLRHLTGSGVILGPVLGEFTAEATGRFTNAMILIEGVVRAGQEAGQVREGAPGVIAHLYSVLINEYVLLEANDDPNLERLTAEQFHALIEGALRPSPQHGLKQ